VESMNVSRPSLKENESGDTNKVRKAAFAGNGASTVKLPVMRMEVA